MLEVTSKEDMGRKKFLEKYEAAFESLNDDNEELMKVARQELPSYLEEVLEADSKKLYSQANFDLEMSQLTSEQFPPENFDLLLQVIQDSRFLKSRHSWGLLSVFEHDGEKLNDVQKTRLLGTLSEIYDLFEHWLPCFFISELVGENFPAENSFAFFQRFTNSQKEIVRTFVPHGFEHAIISSTNQELTAKIRDALVQLEQDKSGQVRGEVRESISRLESQEFKRP